MEKFKYKVFIFIILMIFFSCDQPSEFVRDNEDDPYYYNLEISLKDIDNGFLLHDTTLLNVVVKPADRKISQIEFLFNNQSLFIDSIPPFQTYLNTLGFIDGTYDLSCKVIAPFMKKTNLLDLQVRINNVGILKHYNTFDSLYTWLQYFDGPVWQQLGNNNIKYEFDAPQYSNLLKSFKINPGKITNVKISMEALGSLVIFKILDGKTERPELAHLLTTLYEDSLKALSHYNSKSKQFNIELLGTQETITLLFQVTASETHYNDIWVDLKNLEITSYTVN